MPQADIANDYDRSDKHPSAWQNNPDFGELAQLRIDFDGARMLLDDDVVADGKAKAGAFAGRLGREERVEHLFLHIWRDAGAVVADSDFNTIAKVFGRGSQRRFVIAFVCFRSALGRCMEAVCNHIQESPPDVLRENVCPPGEGPDRTADLPNAFSESNAGQFSYRASVRDMAASELPIISPV